MRTHRVVRSEERDKDTAYYSKKKREREKERERERERERGLNAVIHMVCCCWLTCVSQSERVSECACSSASGINTALYT